jgi:hypothetical protein
MLRTLFVLLLLIPAAANAEWRSAESPHFIVYSGGTEAELNAAVVKLERFHRVLRTLSGVKKAEVPFKPRIFMMADPYQVQKTLGGIRGVLGYYEATSRGSILVGAHGGHGGEDDVSGESTLLHEYTHHFMLDYFPATYPKWFTEGFAEYFGVTRIGSDDKVEIGRAVNSRYEAMQYAWVPTHKMMTAKSAKDFNGIFHSIYSQGWLAVHYLTHNPERQGQLETYLTAINGGQSYEAAMEKAFGKSATRLDTELQTYSRKSRIPTRILPFKPLDLPPFKTRVLSAAEEAFIHHEIMLSRGLSIREAEKFAKEVREIARRFPNDPYALSMLVDAELAVENFAAASAVVDRWLAVQPDAPRGLMHKANLRIRELHETASTDQAAWKAAQQLLVRAVNRAPTDPMVLGAYYDSFVARGVEPPATAQNALYLAHEIVPNHIDFRQKLAGDFERRGLIQDAINTILPVALEVDEGETEREKRRRERLQQKYRRVGSEIRETPLEMLTRLQAKLGQQATASAQ